MRFALAVLALPALAAATAVPRTDGGGAQQCSSGPVQCCNSTVDSKDASTSAVGGLLGLLGIKVGDLTGLIGINCTPINVIGIGGNSCTAQTVCCSNNQFNGLINLGCSPLNVAI
ncbi:fruiting body protein SC1 [Schizophyllum fasciatum]